MWRRRRYADCDVRPTRDGPAGHDNDGPISYVDGIHTACHDDYDHHSHANDHSDYGHASTAYDDFDHGRAHNHHEHNDSPASRRVRGGRTVPVPSRAASG